MLNSLTKLKLSLFFSNNKNLLLLANIFWYANLGFINTFIGIYYFSLSDGNYLLTGFLIGIPALSLVISSFIFGNLADLIGEKKVITFAFAALVISDISYYLIEDSVTFFFAYIFFNFLLASFGPSMNRLASRSVKQGEDIFGIMGAISSFGYFIGTVIGGFLYDQLEMSTIFLLALFSASYGLFTITRLKESNTTVDHVNSESMPKESNKIFNKETLKLICSKNVIAMFMIGFILYLGANLSGPFFYIYLNTELGMKGWLWGLMNGFATLLGMFSAWGIGKYLHTNFRIPTLYSIIGYFIVYLVFWLTNDILLLFLVYAIPAYAGLMVSAPALVAASVPEKVRGTAMGLLIALQNLGLGFGAIFGGIISEHYNSALNNFLFSAVISLIPLAITIIFLKNHKESKEIT